MNLLINYVLFKINKFNRLTKCHFNYEGSIHGTSQLDDGFRLAIKHTPLHTHPRPLLCVYMLSVLCLYLLYVLCVLVLYVLCIYVLLFYVYMCCLFFMNVMSFIYLGVVCMEEKYYWTGNCG